MARIRDDESAKKYGDRDTLSQFYDLESDDRQEIRNLAVDLYLSTNPGWLLRWIDRLPGSRKLDAKQLAGALVGSKLLKTWTNTRSCGRNGKMECEECGKDLKLHCWNCCHTKRSQNAEITVDAMDLDHDPLPPSSIEQEVQATEPSPSMARQASIFSIRPCSSPIKDSNSKNVNPDRLRPPYASKPESTTRQTTSVRHQNQLPRRHSTRLKNTTDKTSLQISTCPARPVQNMNITDPLLPSSLPRTATNVADYQPLQPSGSASASSPTSRINLRSSTARDIYCGQQRSKSPTASSTLTSESAIVASATVSEPVTGERSTLQDGDLIQSELNNPKQLCTNARKEQNSDSGPEAGRELTTRLPTFKKMNRRRNSRLPRNLHTTKRDSCKPQKWIKIRRSMTLNLEIRLIIYIYVGVVRCKRRDPLKCSCRVECDEACLNRATHYECDEQNCGLNDPQGCSNRPFQKAAIHDAYHGTRSYGFEVFSVSAHVGLY